MTDPFAERASLQADQRIAKQVAFNMRRALGEDQTEEIDRLAAAFDFEAARGFYWNPPEFSFLWGTPLWDQASEDQRRSLNHIYWAAYYAQITSAEIATIFFNQIAAAGLYGAGNDFRPLCDTLDLETRQERAHINAFRTVGEKVERALFGARLFTYAMRGPYAETMVFGPAGSLKRWWRSAQIRAFAAFAPDRPTLAAHYLMIRGIRTLNGKMIQERLAKHIEAFQGYENAPIPARISKAHYTDESYHFNTSRIMSHEVPKLLPAADALERMAINRAVDGCQLDHTPFSVAINGIFWHDPALYEACLTLFRSPTFGMDEREAREMLRRCFTEESEGFHASATSHHTAVDNYRAYVEKTELLTPANREMRRMSASDLASRLRVNKAAYQRRFAH
ncbi:MAG: hypothetical protein JNJ73_17050 [Hyphomonadaceae bacterium]|nr:hypothetical protein [Hyphomonadaceae bacterium]